MKAWFSTADLIGLPGCGSARNVQLKAERQHWVSRPREGRGGGREYHIDSLPPEARAELAARALTSAMSIFPPSNEGEKINMAPRAVTVVRGAAVHMVRDTAAGAKAEARAEILGAFESYLARAGLAVADAALNFAALYNAGAVDVSPATRRHVPAAGGATIRRWRRAAARDGLAALADKSSLRRKGKGRIDRDTGVRALITGLIADRPHVSAKHVMQALRARLRDEPARIPAYRTVQRFLENWKRANADVFLAHTNPDSWKGKRRLAFGDQSARVTRLNQLWEMDATPADVLCADGRHAVVGLIDVYSRRAMVLVTKTSRTEAILALTRRAIMAWGVPEIVKTDQGKDYTSVWMRRALQQLGVRHEMCPPFTPEGKPHIERFFGTMTRGLFEQLPAFIGHDVAGRKDIEARKSFAQRMGGAEAIACGASAAQLQQWCDRWLDSIYHHERHGGLNGRSPFQAAAEWPGAIARVENERALDVLLAEAPGAGVRLVGKKGIAVENTFFIAPELAAYAGRRVHVRFDAADMGRLYVFDADDSAFICVAVDPERLGLDRKAIAAEARNRQKAIVSDGRKQLRAAARAIKPGTIVDEILRDGESRASRVTAFPRAGLEYDTPDLAAARAAIAPKAPATLTDDDRDAADALFARLQGAPERAAGEVVDFPAPKSPDARPDFDTDHDFARWVLDNPGRATAADRARVLELLALPSMRLLLDTTPSDAAALFGGMPRDAANR